jgi:hypothetical protein
MRILPIGVACLALALAACAQGTNPGDDDDDDDDPIDARIDAPDDDTDAPQPIDAAIDAAIDAPVSIDAAIDAPTDGQVVIDAPIDAPMPIDAPIDAPCMPTTMQLLVNPNLDANPVGTGWVETLIDPMYPLITGDDGIPEHTAPYKSWMGGIEAPGLGTVSDEMYQQVTVPAGTTMLVVRGMYEVRTAEAASSTVYDGGAIELTNTAGTVLEQILTMGNPTPTTAWTQFQRTFTGNYAGQAVRLRFRSTNDFLDPTSFYFDTLVLEATVACP